MNTNERLRYEIEDDTDELLEDKYRLNNDNVLFYGLYEDLEYSYWIKED